MREAYWQKKSRIDRDAIRLKLPARTLTRRAPRYVQACVLYVWGGLSPVSGDLVPPVRELSRLAKLAGVKVTNLRLIAKEDDWGTFATKMDLELASRNAFTPKRIEEELAKQRELLPRLRDERVRLAGCLPSLTPGTKAYSSCLADMREVTSQIERIEGLDFYRQGMTELIKSQKKPGSGGAKAGVSEVLDGALPFADVVTES